MAENLPWPLDDGHADLFAPLNSCSYYWWQWMPDHGGACRCLCLSCLYLSPYLNFYLRFCSAECFLLWGGILRSLVVLLHHPVVLSLQSVPHIPTMPQILWLITSLIDWLRNCEGLENIEIQKLDLAHLHNCRTTKLCSFEQYTRRRIRLTSYQKVHYMEKLPIAHLWQFCALAGKNLPCEIKPLDT